MERYDNISYKKNVSKAKRRLYMRNYMKAYRAKKKEKKEKEALNENNL